MAAVGGDFTEITCNHPTVGTVVLYPKADEDSTLDTGGYRSADEDSGVDGSGAMIDTLTQRRWSFEGTVANDMNDRKEMEKVVQLAASPVQGDWTFTHINGTVYTGKGKPVGDIQAAGKSATFSLKVAGGGKMQQI